MAAIRYTVALKGLFFRNPVGQLHRNIYTVLERAASEGAAATAANLTPGRGLLSGALRDSIEPRMVKATRYNTFTGRARVVTGARGSWAPTPSAGTKAPWTYPEARNRAVAKKVNARQKFTYRGAALTKAWFDANRSWISRIIARGLS